MMNEKYDRLKFLAMIEVEYAFLERTLAHIPADKMTEGGVCGHWSVKDLLAHLTAWNRRMLGWIAQARRGQPPALPEPGATWGDMDAINNRCYEEDKDCPLDEVLADFRSIHREAFAEVERLTEEELFSLTRFQGIFNQPPWQLIAANTFLHYREHTGQMREWWSKQAE